MSTAKKDVPSKTMTTITRVYMTDSSKLQIALSGLRELLGFDVEKGGAGRSFGPNEEFLVCERRFDGSQTHSF